MLNYCSSIISHDFLYVVKRSNSNCFSSELCRKIILFSFVRAVDSYGETLYNASVAMIFTRMQNVSNLFTISIFFILELTGEMIVKSNKKKRRKSAFRSIDQKLSRMSVRRLLYTFVCLLLIIILLVIAELLIIIGAGQPREIHDPSGDMAYVSSPYGEFYMDQSGYTVYMSEPDSSPSDTETSDETTRPASDETTTTANSQNKILRAIPTGLNIPKLFESKSGSAQWIQFFTYQGRIYVISEFEVDGISLEKEIGKTAGGIKDSWTASRKETYWEFASSTPDNLPVYKLKEYREDFRLAVKFLGKFRVFECTRKWNFETISDLFSLALPGDDTAKVFLDNHPNVNYYWTFKAIGTENVKKIHDLLAGLRIAETDDAYADFDKDPNLCLIKLERDDKTGLLLYYSPKLLAVRTSFGFFKVDAGQKDYFNSLCGIQ